MLLLTPDECVASVVAEAEAAVRALREHVLHSSHVARPRPGNTDSKLRATMSLRLVDGWCARGEELLVQQQQRPEHLHHLRMPRCAPTRATLHDLSEAGRRWGAVLPSSAFSRAVPSS
eukprot:COSAG05_NODE_14277_length_402_cov_0.782178_1_plen_117_part_10